MSFYRGIDEKINAAARAVRSGFRSVLSGLETKTPVQLAQLQALAGETLQAVELMQHFGMTSSPPGGTQCIVLPLGGKTSHSVIVGTENGAFRVAVEQGETCIYNQWGAKITFKKERRIEVECDEFVLNAKNSVTVTTKQIQETASTSAAYSSPSLTFEGAGGGTANAVMRANIQQQGTHTSSGDQIAGGISLMDHVHNNVESGNDTTGTPQ